MILEVESFVGRTKPLAGGTIFCFLPGAETDAGDIEEQLFNQGQAAGHS